MKKLFLFIFSFFIILLLCFFLFPLNYIDKINNGNNTADGNTFISKHTINNKKNLYQLSVLYNGTQSNAQKYDLDNLSANYYERLLYINYFKNDIFKLINISVYNGNVDLDFLENYKNLTVRNQNRTTYDILDNKEVIKLEKEIPFELSEIFTKKENGYTIKILELSYSHFYKNGNLNLNIAYPQIYGLKDSNIEHKVNNILKFAVAQGICNKNENYLNTLRAINNAEKNNEIDFSDSAAIHGEFNSHPLPANIKGDIQPSWYVYENHFFYENYFCIKYETLNNLDKNSNYYYNTRDFFLTVDLTTGEIVNLSNYADIESVRAALKNGKYSNFSFYSDFGKYIDDADDIVSTDDTCDDDTDEYYHNMSFSSFIKKEINPAWFDNNYYEFEKGMYAPYNSNNFCVDDKYVYIAFINPNSVVLCQNFTEIKKEGTLNQDFIKIKKDDIIIKQ